MTRRFWETINPKNKFAINARKVEAKVKKGCAWAQAMGKNKAATFQPHWKLTTKEVTKVQSQLSKVRNFLSFLKKTLLFVVVCLRVHLFFFSIHNRFVHRKSFLGVK